MTPEKTIQELFNKRGERFEIPSYQRAYSWGEVQLKQFVEDIETVKDQYYLGHFLFETGEEKKNVLNVIDGQQRMTTIVIFFSAMYFELKQRKKDGKDVDLIEDDVLYDLEEYYLMDPRKKVQKFSTVTEDNNFFKNEIVLDNAFASSSTDTNSKKRILAAKNTFQKFFKDKTTAQLLVWKELIENAAITTYEVKDKVQAIRIFAFQNDRGKDLTTLEKLKSYFMLQILLEGNSEEHKKACINYVEQEISIIYKTIESIPLNEDTILNYYWRAFSGQGYNAEKLIENVKKALKNADDKLAWIEEHITKIKCSFEIVKEIQESKDSYVLDLKHMNNMALSYPFFIRYKYFRKNDSIAALAKLLANLTFRYVLRGGRAAIESRLNHYLVSINSATDIRVEMIEPIIDALKTSGWWGYWSDSEMQKHLEGGYIYYNGMKNFILWKYELSLYDLGYNLTVTYDEVIKKVNIEHIAPQTPTKGKPKKYGYGAYNKKKEPLEGIESGEWLHCIGNLMLLSQPHNSSVSNGPFQKKLDSFQAKGNLRQHKELLTFVTDKDNPVWDVAAIENRYEKIVNFAMDYWSLDKL